MYRCPELSNALIFLAVALSAAACSSDTPGFTPPPAGDVDNNDIIEVWSCEERGGRPAIEDVSCNADKRFVKGVCAELRCDATDLACCPGMTCDLGGSCAVPAVAFTTCATDEGCTGGMRCLDRPRINTDEKTCGWKPVDSTGACPDGGQPFNGRCIVGMPCGDGCSVGAVCNIDTNRCERPPVIAEGEDDGCTQTCAASEVLVFADPDAMLFDQCCAVSCACETLPPLATGRWGRFSDSVVAIDGDSRRVWVSAFDATYGDMVVAELDATSATVSSLEYIDGVPDDGPAVADPSGIRAGRDGPGPEVGRYTSIARSVAGDLFVAYYDVDNGDLKLAHRAVGATSWTVGVVDDDADGLGESDDDSADQGDVGLFTSLLVDESGTLHLSYLAQRTLQSGVLTTTPMYAQSTTAFPVNRDDWVHIVVDPVIACSGGCADTEACVRVGSAAECRRLDTVAIDNNTCGCACDEACVTGGCFERLPDVLAEPCEGFCAQGLLCVGDGGVSGGTACLPPLSSGCSCSGDDVCVDTDTTAASVPECRAPRPYSRLARLTQSSGQFTSLVLHNNVPTMVFYDGSRRHLRAAVADFTADETPGAFTSFALRCDVDEDFGQHATLAVDSGNNLLVAYQGFGGSTLWAYEGTDFLTGTHSLVDDGVRDGGVNVVGAAASVAFSSDDTVYIVYTDQTQNDLLVASGGADSWTISTVLSEGAYGTAANLLIVNDVAYISSYLRSRDENDVDSSRLILKVIALDEL